jgi:hypothetical protein
VIVFPKDHISKLIIKATAKVKFGLQEFGKHIYFLNQGKLIIAYRIIGNI